MWVSSSTKGARRHWIWLVLLLSLQVVHGAEEIPAENTTTQDGSTTQDTSTTQNNSTNNSTNNNCDCDCDYFLRQVTCPFDHLDNPHYDKQNDILIFVDQYLGKVCIYDPNTGCTSSSCELDEPLGSVIPLLNSCNEYIIGYGPKMAKMKWDGCCDTCPEITIISRHDKEKRGIVFNDGKADLFGHLLMNTKGPVGPDGETESGYATLYRYSKRECGLKDALGRNDREDYLNGIAFNCNYTTMYMCETKKKKIYKFDYDLKTGKPSNKQTVFDYDKASEDGRPNGLAMDCCGRLWVASQGAGKVLEVDPDTSKVLRTIKIPTRDVIAVTFGGCGLDVMYVTTSQRFLTCDEKKEQPQAGSVFAVYNLCAQGLPANDACICRGGCFCSGFYDPCGCTSCGKDDKDDDDKDNKNEGDSQDENSNNGGSESNNNDSNNNGNNTTNGNSNSCRSCGYGGKYGFRTASSGDYERCRGCCEVCGGVGYRFGACYGGGSCGGGKSGGCNNGYGSCGCSKSGGCNNGYGSCGCSKSCGCNNGYGSCGCCKSCGCGNGYGSCGCCNSGGFNSYGLCDCGSSCGSSKGYSSCCCCKSYVTEKDSGTSTNNTSDGSSDGTNGSGSGCSCGNGVSGSCGGCGNGSCGSSGSCGGCGRSGCGSCGGNGGDDYGCGGCGRGGYTSCVGGGSCSCYGLCGPCGSCGSCGGSGCGGRCGSCGGRCGSCGGSGCGGRCGSCGGSGCGGRCGSCGCGSSGNCCPSSSSGPPRGSCGCCSRGPYGSGRAGYVPGACGSCRGNGGCDNLVEGLLSVLAAKVL